MESLHYYMASRPYIIYIFPIIFIFTACSYSHIMASNNNLSTDVTMESLVSEIRTQRADLVALQAQESMQKLSLDERGRERPSITFTHPYPTTLKSNTSPICLAKTSLPGDHSFR